MAAELDQYEYELPRELIAQQPVARRDDARLLVVDRGEPSLRHAHVRDLPEILRRGDRLALNNTRVTPAALVGRRTATGGAWQGLFLSASPEGFWRLLGKTRGRLVAGESITLVEREGADATQLRLLEKWDGGQWLARPEPLEDAMSLLDRVGRIPLPHYIRGGQMMPEDVERYQTVFATEPGAVAAPTAGLHFTNSLLERLGAAGVRQTRLTLHVGIGTFRPITAETLSEHDMHSEWACLDDRAAEELRAAREAGGRIVAVGTTAVRTLESAAAGGELAPYSDETDLFIRPPYEFRATDALLTNFHLPRTTLLVLVYTFGGRDLVRRAYAEAIAEQYRFYSYGDAMLIV
jgi:S-adenosylmethionine:tRNA ribosyltransferase-isomerase